MNRKKISLTEINLFLFSKVKVPKVINSEEMKDQGTKHDTLNSPTIIMSSGGCKSPMGNFLTFINCTAILKYLLSTGLHANGGSWHPVIASHGEQKCIKCKCKVN